jgi:hypothetical protein
MADRGAKETIEQIGVFELIKTSYDIDGDAFREKLAREDRPDHWQSYFPDKAWLESQLAVIVEREGAKLFRPYSQGWFFESMLNNLEMMRSAIAANQADWAAIHACELGRLMAESNFDIVWSAHALRGQKTVTDGEKSRKGRLTAEERLVEVERLVAESGGKLGKMAAYSLVGEAEGVKAKAIETDCRNARRARKKVS